MSAAATPTSGAAPAPDPRDAYWAALEEGRLTFQRCALCGHAWLPPRSECPQCWSTDWGFETAGGGGRVVSWVIFHVAFDEAFKDRLPYNVAVVELAEGPRLVTNLVDFADTGEDVCDRAVALVVERDHGRALPRFRLS